MTKPNLPMGPWEYFARREGKTAAMIEQLKKHRGGSIIVRPRDAQTYAELLEAEGATVVCTVSCDWPKETPK